MNYLREAPVDEETFQPFVLSKTAFGFIPNFFRAQTMRPDILDAEVQLMGAILIKEGALTRQQKEYIFLVCSAANLSTYCVTAHCEIVRMLGIEGPEPERIAVDHTATNIPVPLKALLTFAVKLNSQATKVSRRDIDVLRTYGSATSRFWKPSSWLASRSSPTSLPSVSGPCRTSIRRKSSSDEQTPHRSLASEPTPHQNDRGRNLAVSGASN